MNTLEKILREVLATDKSLLSRRDELLAALEEKVPSNLRRDFAPIKKAISLNVGEKFLVGEQDKEATKKEVSEILKAAGMQAVRIDFVVESFSSALGWNIPMVPVVEEQITHEEIKEPPPQQSVEIHKNIPVESIQKKSPEIKALEPVQKTKTIEIIKEQRENVVKPQQQSQSRQESNYASAPRNDTDKIFTTRGRLNRKAYFIQTLKLIVLMIVGAILAQFLIGVPILIAACVGSYMISIRRLHDLNKSGWWVLLYFVPYVNLVFGLYLLFKSGTPGYNRYGEDPLTE